MLYITVLNKWNFPFPYKKKKFKLVFFFILNFKPLISKILIKVFHSPKFHDSKSNFLIPNLNFHIPKSPFQIPSSQSIYLSHLVKCSKFRRIFKQRMTLRFESKRRQFCYIIIKCFFLKLTKGLVAKKIKKIMFSK